MKVKNIFVAILFFSLIFSSCRTMADYDFSSVDSALGYGDFSGAQEILEKDSKKIYASHGEVIALLDKGILLHFAGEYKESNRTLSEAEKLINTYRAKSVSQAIGSAIVNDTVMDYAGEDFEDIYTNIFMCLNYIALGLTDDAMVEIRRFDNKMKTVGRRYQAVRADMQKQIEGNPSGIETKSVKFHNSAFARYLSMLLYRADGKEDEARIDLKNIIAAFNMQAEVYDFTMPAGLEKEISVQPAAARINFVAFSGFAPTKREEAVRILLHDFYYKLALPIMQSRPSAVASIKVKATSKENGGVYQTRLSKIESIDNIAKDVFNDHYAAIVWKTLLRSISKTATGTALRVHGEKDGGTGGLISGLLGLFVQASTEFTERADTRCTRCFPGNASVGSLGVPPGTYDVQIEFCAPNGKVISTEMIPSFTAKAGGALNLAEAVCYR